jgi:hypothetical protein
MKTLAYDKFFFFFFFLFIIIFFFFLFFFFFFFYFSCTQSSVDLRLPVKSSPIPSVSGHCTHIFYSLYHQILFSLVSPSFPWPSSSPCSFHSDSTYYFGSIL